MSMEEKAKRWARIIANKGYGHHLTRFRYDHSLVFQDIPVAQETFIATCKQCGKGVKIILTLGDPTIEFYGSPLNEACLR